MAFQDVAGCHDAPDVHHKKRAGPGQTDIREHGTPDMYESWICWLRMRPDSVCRDPRDELGPT